MQIVGTAPTTATLITLPARGAPPLLAAGHVEPEHVASRPARQLRRLRQRYLHQDMILGTEGFIEEATLSPGFSVIFQVSAHASLTRQPRP
ncbi:hypothetical protein GCM10011415_26690 [Salipiger pallidus]|uniref:Uncharacterized protein n=1 Tax=Salipiger pallidus TaxID=1775170 RepID=A0A8J2ZL76_9RHOB|nr:hypothetical protein [Salipiger pallidus]GGG76587.1 hypothetical protein GCM10011415_26690 [Salipiger pallidus]